MRSSGRIVVALALFVWAVLPANGDEPRLFAGGKAGANVSWLTGDAWEREQIDPHDADNRGRWGSTFGGFVSAVFPSLFAVRAELLYTEHGGGIDGTLGDSELEIRVRTYLFDVSLFGERFFPVGPGYLSIYLGPTVLLIQSDLRTDFTAAGNSGTEETAPDVEQVFGASGGVGYGILWGPGAVFMEARYTRAFTSYDTDDEYIGNAVTALVGYGFDF